MRSSHNRTSDSSFSRICLLNRQDVENYDPILNPVLNRELRRTGGRVLITLGDQDIDLSPSFVIFLSTRDPTVEFPPDICSRVTFVNFTVTRSSLQSQCLNKVLKAERPDIDAKRSDLLKLQGYFQILSLSSCLFVSWYGPGVAPCLGSLPGESRNSSRNFSFLSFFY